MSKILVNNQDNPFAVKQWDTDTKEPQIKKTKQSYQVIRALKGFHEAGLKTAPKQSKMYLLKHHVSIQQYINKWYSGRAGTTRGTPVIRHNAINSLFVGLQYKTLSHDSCTGLVTD